MHCRIVDFSHLKKIISSLPDKETLLFRIHSKDNFLWGGTFEMGSNQGDADAQKDEMVNGKKHRVNVSSFYMGKYEVTGDSLARQLPLFGFK